jgi:hypothetical protein
LVTNKEATVFCDFVSNSNDIVRLAERNR